MFVIIKMYKKNLKKTINIFTKKYFSTEFAEFASM